jgi:hypothetical protein
VQPRRHRPHNDEEPRPQPQHRHLDQDLHAFARPPRRQFDDDDDARPPRHPFDADDKFGKLKFTIPKFTSDDDADAYFSWAIKVDKIFCMHNYSEEKKVAMASLEFKGYANIWWEQVVAK